MIHQTGGDEQEVAEAIQINDGPRRDLFAVVERHEHSLRPPTDGPRDMEIGGRRRAAGQNELLERLEFLFKTIDGLLESRGLHFADAVDVELRRLRRGQFGAEIEQFVLHVLE